MYLYDGFLKILLFFSIQVSLLLIYLNPNCGLILIQITEFHSVSHVKTMHPSLCISTCTPLITRHDSQENLNECKSLLTAVKSAGPHFPVS